MKTKSSPKRKDEKLQSRRSRQQAPPKRGLMSSFFMPLYIMASLLLITGYIFLQRDYFFPTREEASLNIKILLDRNDSYANDILREAMNQAAFDYNCELTFIAPLNPGNAKEQLKLLEKEADEVSDGLIIMPVDREKITEACAKLAPAADILFVNTAGGAEPYPALGTDCREAGQALADYMAERHQNMPAVRLFYSDVAGAAEKAMQKAFEARWQERGGRVKTERILGRNPELGDLAEEMARDRDSLWLALDADALEVLSRAKKQLPPTILKPALYGRGSSPYNADGIRDGSIQAMLAENSYSLGYLAVSRLAESLRGERRLESESLKFHLIDRDNVGDHDNELLLFPIIH